MSIQNVVTVCAALLAFGASILATAASIYNVRLGRFARERWWERKFETYSRITESLSSLVYYHEEHVDIEMEGTHPTEEAMAALGEIWRKAHTEVRKATAVGAFLISPAAEAALQVWRDTTHGPDPRDWLAVKEHHSAAARDCLTAVVQAAKVDLAAWNGRAA